MLLVTGWYLAHFGGMSCTCPAMSLHMQLRYALLCFAMLGVAKSKVLHGMFNPSQVNLAADPEFFNDIHADVEQEQHGATGESNRNAEETHWGDRVSQGVSGCLSLQTLFAKKTRTKPGIPESPTFQVNLSRKAELSCQQSP